MTTRTFTVTGPAHFAVAIINGDRSGLSDLDQSELDAFLAQIGKYDTITLEPNAQPYFTWSYRLYSPGAPPSVEGGNVVDYTVLVTD